MSENKIAGGCTCGEIRYELSLAPMFVNCCHCTWCQRETGSAFAVNAMVENAALDLVKGQVEVIDTPTKSGRGQRLSRCPTCRITLWGNFSSAGEAIHFVRTGTLDNTHQFPPDAHIFTSTKRPWVVLGDDIPAFSEFYVKAEMWSAESIARYDKAVEI